MEKIDRIRNNPRLIYILIAILALTSAGCAGTADSTKPETAPLTVTLHEIQGQVQVLKPEDGLFTDVVDGQQLRVNDQLLTYNDGHVKLVFSSGTTVYVSPLTTFIVESLENQDDFPTAKLRLEVGEVWVVLHGGTLAVDTPAGTATVVGSFMSVKGRLNKLGTFITCLEGNCRVENRIEIVDLLSGQLAELNSLDLPIRPGRMNHLHFERWLEIVPEAEQVLAAVTETVQAYYGNAGTPIPTNTPVPTDPPLPTSPFTDTPLPPTATSTPKPPAATATNTSTPLPTPTATATSVPTHTNTPAPTSTPTATYTPTNTPDPTTLFTNADGPMSSAISVCNNFYTVDVSDGNGVAFVRVQYSLNAPPKADSSYFLLTQNGSTWSAWLNIDTTSNSGMDTVHWRFWASDELDNDTYFPSSGSFAFIDDVGCNGSN